MLAIRMQRTGRKGHAMFRVVVQDARRTPTSGKVVALLGSYDPHTKTTTVSKEKAAFYLEHGAHPSDRVARLLKSEGVKLPNWVELEGKKAGKLRNPEKLRRNQPKDAAPAEPSPEAETATAESPAEAEETSETESTEQTNPTPEVASTPTDEEPAANEAAKEASADTESPAATEAEGKPEQTA